LRTQSPVRVLCAALAAALTTTLPARAEDIDLFTTPSGGGVNPNVLIIIDNSANWNANNQKWPVGKQGEGELIALRDVLNEPYIDSTINLGFMFTMDKSHGTSTPNPPYAPVDGGYMRFAIRPMNNVNKLALQEMIGTSTCASPSTNSLTGVPNSNCILKNFSSQGTNQNNSASTQFSAAMFEAFKYFGGYTNPAGAATNTPGAPVDPTHFGTQRYAGYHTLTDPGAFTDATKTIYKGPINADGSNNCANNFIILISNGLPPQDLNPSVLSGLGGDVTNPPPQKSNYAANWAKFLYQTDVNAVGGRQFVRTYTIDVYNAQQDFDATILLKNMAKYGGGRYFKANNNTEIMNALKEILTEIQAVNSVFASASLPINATNRSQNENQVFIGMFRPDPQAKPRWYGNLKRFQISLFGDDARLADADEKEAVSATTGFLQPCARSFWTVDSGNYWSFNPASAGTCTLIAGSANSDLPDGGVVEKGGAAEVLRRGNSPSATAPFVVSRTMYTCGAACGAMVPFSTAAVTAARTGAADATENTAIVDFTFGKDVGDENGNNVAAPAGIGVPAGVNEPRPSIHGDIAHSRPLPVNFGGSRKVEVIYGANDGALRAVSGETGQELWSFVAPEHHAKLKRLYANDPLIQYPNQPVVPTAKSKDYFFDGSLGLYQNIDNSKVWVYATQRRGGRMVYAFDITATSPVLKWAFGCPNLTNDTGCSAGATEMGQSWSVPNVAFIRGYSTTNPVVIMGGGYDSCEDVDAAVTTCVAPKGRRVFVLDAATGSVLQSFTTDGPVAADVTLMNRFFGVVSGNSMVDTAYVATTRGSIYRIDFVDKTTGVAKAAGAWTITKVASTSLANRKFLFGPSALAIGTKIYLALGSGDRERPLINNYPYATPVTNRFYMTIDDLSDAATLDLDGASMTNFTSDTDCGTVLATGQRGWYMDLEAGRGEQTVTSSVIFGGTIFFSTNRPLATIPGTCASNLGEARGYAVNLFNASGVIGSGDVCGGSRSGEFTGGGIPPSPVVGTVPVSVPGGGTKPINVLIGGIDLETGSGSPIGAQQPPVPIKQIRSRVYWYPQGERN
jgi:type IV pilus assembly protein PilY1